MQTVWQAPCCENDVADDQWQNKLTLNKKSNNKYLNVKSPLKTRFAKLLQRLTKLDQIEALQPIT